MERSRILIIEEDAQTRYKIDEIFSLAKYEVITASSGREGVELCRMHTIDLILCGADMKEMDGFGVLGLLNKFVETAGIPFMFLIGQNQHAHIRRAMEMGAEGFLLVPFNDAELLNTVQIRLRKKKSQHELFKKDLFELQQFTYRPDDLYELHHVIKALPARQIKKKHVVYYEREWPKGIYMVVSGKIKTFVKDEQGRELITGIFLPNDYFGLQAVLNDVNRETAEAMEASEIIFMPSSMVDELLMKYPKIARQFMHILVQYIHNRDTQLIQLGYYSVRKRVAEIIVKLSNRINSDQEMGRLTISRSDLAAVAGIASETLSRVLSDLKAQGIINKDDNEIVILKSEALMYMKN